MKHFEVREETRRIGNLDISAEEAKHDLIPVFVAGLNRLIEKAYKTQTWDDFEEKEKRKLSFLKRLYMIKDSGLKAYSQEIRNFKIKLGENG